MKLEIYYEDLNEKGKEKVLKFFNINSPEELNLDVQPLFVLEK